MYSLQSLIIAIVLLAIAIAVAGYVYTTFHAEARYTTFAKVVSAYADSHRVKICAYNPGPGLYSSKLALVVGQLSSQNPTVVEVGQLAEIIFTFDTPLPYALGTRGEGNIIDGRGWAYPLSFLVVEDVEKIKC